MLQIEHLDKSYKDRQVLKEISLKLDTQQKNIYGLLGPNGAGKTSLMKTLAGILEYSKGKIFFDGEEADSKRLRRDCVFIATGERGLRFRNTVQDNVFCFGAMKGCREKEVKKNLEMYADLLQFEPFLKREVNTLSTGEKRKAQILCGLCSDAKILMLDEPSNGLDIDAQREFQEVLKNVSEHCRKTILVSSHELDFLCGVVNHYIFLVHGQILREVSGSMGTEEVKKIYFQLREEVQQ